MDHKQKANDSNKRRKTSVEDEVHERLVQMLISDAGSEMEVERKRKEPSRPGQQCEINRVVDHRITARGVWQFHIQFKGHDRVTEWVDDCDCDCEKSINEYLAGTGVPRTVYSFCRVSSKKQTGPRHVSLEAQEQRIHQTIQRMYGANPGRVKNIRLSASAYRGIPSALARIGAAARAGDAIFIYRIDRLSRNIFKYLAFLEELNDRGVQIYAVDEGMWYHERRLNFMQGILDANKEAEIIGRRVKSSLEYLKSIGREYSGTTAYGWRMIRNQANHLVQTKDSEEQGVIRRIKQWGSGYQTIADHLNREGITKRGKRWNAGMIRYVIQNN
jgi:DNA invertase Pin-like site-specific DNA recombinase